jgi:hypothetical protein
VAQPTQNPEKKKPPALFSQKGIGKRAVGKEVSILLLIMSTCFQGRIISSLENSIII